MVGFYSNLFGILVKMEIHTKACTWEKQHMKLELCCHKSKSNQKLGERLEQISSCAF